jgi:hypothetical protein
VPPPCSRSPLERVPPFERGPLAKVPRAHGGPHHLAPPLTPLCWPVWDISADQTEATVARGPHDRFSSGNTTAFKKRHSGNPKGRRIVREMAEKLFAELAPQFAPLDPVDRTLLMQAAMLSIQSRRVGDPDAAVRMASEARRTLETLRRNRLKSPKAQPDSFAEHLATLSERGDER